MAQRKARRATHLTLRQFADLVVDQTRQTVALIGQRQGLVCDIESRRCW